MSDLDLSAACQGLLKLLREADGAFVRGAFLAQRLNLDIAQLQQTANQLRRKRPDLPIEGRKGHGFRLVVDAPGAAPDGAAPQFEPPAKPVRRRLIDNTANDRLALSMQLLRQLPGNTAELVKAIGVESGETAIATVHRLLSYGAEVHYDLVAQGENPLVLRSPRRGAVDRPL